MNLRLSSEETFIIVYGSEVFRRCLPFLLSPPCNLFPFLRLPSFFFSCSHTFMHSRGPCKQLRDSHKKRTIVHRVYHFPRFFATRLLSPAGAGSFFEVTTHPVRTTPRARIPYGTRRREAEHSALQLQCKKVKSLNAHRATISTVLKLKAARTGLCKNVAKCHAR